MAFAGILDRIRTKKKELVLNAQDAYYSLLKEVARGEETDVDDAAIVIDAAGKSEDDFERDVATMEQRFALAGQLKARVEIERSLPALQAKLDAANRAYNDAVQRLQPTIQIAFTALQEAQNAQQSMSNVDAKLCETCLNQTLLSRERELLAKRLAVHQKRRPLFDDLEMAKAYLSTCRAGLEGERGRKKILPLTPTEKGISHQEHHWRMELKKQESLVAQLTEAVRLLDDELLPINNELASISKEKLVP
jgi:hypothetical protein